MITKEKLQTETKNLSIDNSNLIIELKEIDELYKKIFRENNKLERKIKISNNLINALEHKIWEKDKIIEIWQQDNKKLEAKILKLELSNLYLKENVYNLNTKNHDLKEFVKKQNETIKKTIIKKE